MLDRVAARQIRCPKCGRSDDLYITDTTWSTTMVGAPVGGGLISGDTDWQEVTAPSELVVEQPRLALCGNHPSTKDEPNGHSPFHWFVLPEDTLIDYEPNTLADLKGWA